MRATLPNARTHTEQDHVRPPGVSDDECEAGDRFGHHALWLGSFRASGNENTIGL